MSLPHKLVFMTAGAGVGGGRHYGGGGHFVHQFIPALAARGWEITLVCPAVSPLFHEEALRKAATCRDCDLAARIRQPVRFARGLVDWSRTAADCRGALLYADGYRMLKWAAFAQARYGFHAVCHLHESATECYFTLRARWLAPRIDRFIAISEEVRRRFIRGSGIAPERIDLIYNGLPIGAEPVRSPEERAAVRSGAGVSNTCLLVTMVARTDRLKGHEVLLRAVRRVRAQFPQAHFLILGLQNLLPIEAELYEHLLRVIDAEGIADAVTHTGYSVDARRIMRYSDIAVVPSTEEGFGRTAVEAMAEGTPLVASRVGGLAEIITHGHDGWLVPPGDSTALADGIIALLGDPQRRAQLAANGYQTAVTRFSLKSMVDAIERRLLDVVAAAGL